VFHAENLTLSPLANQTLQLDPDITLSPSSSLIIGGQYYIAAVDNNGYLAESPLFELIPPGGSSMTISTASCPSYPLSTTTITVNSLKSGQLATSTSTCPILFCPSISGVSMLTVTRITQTETQTVFTTQNDTRTKDEKTTITLTSTSTRTKEVTSTVTVTATKTKG